MITNVWNAEEDIKPESARDRDREGENGETRSIGNFSLAVRDKEDLIREKDGMIAAKEESIRELNFLLMRKIELVREKDAHILDLEELIDEKEARLCELALKFESLCSRILSESSENVSRNILHPSTKRKALQLRQEELRKDAREGERDERREEESVRERTTDCSRAQENIGRGEEMEGEREGSELVRTCRERPRESEGVSERGVTELLEKENDSSVSEGESKREESWEKVVRDSRESEELKSTSNDRERRERLKGRGAEKGRGDLVPEEREEERKFSEGEKGEDDEGIEIEGQEREGQREKERGKSGRDVKEKEEDREPGMGTERDRENERGSTFNEREKGGEERKEGEGGSEGDMEKVSHLREGEEERDEDEGEGTDEEEAGERALHVRRREGEWRRRRREERGGETISQVLAKNGKEEWRKSFPKEENESLSISISEFQRMMEKISSLTEELYSARSKEVEMSEKANSLIRKLTEERNLLVDLTRTKIWILKNFSARRGVQLSEKFKIDGNSWFLMMVLPSARQNQKTQSSTGSNTCLSKTNVKESLEGVRSREKREERREATSNEAEQGEEEVDEDEEEDELERERDEPEEQEEEDEEGVSIFIKPCSCALNVRFSLSIVNRMDPEMSVSHEIVSYVRPEGLGWSSFMSLFDVLDPQMGFVVDDTIIVKAVIQLN